LKGILDQMEKRELLEEQGLLDRPVFREILAQLVFGEILGLLELLVQLDQLDYADKSEELVQMEKV
jgi:hypothetical protein